MGLTLQARDALGPGAVPVEELQLLHERNHTLGEDAGGLSFGDRVRVYINGDDTPAHEGAFAGLYVNFFDGLGLVIDCTTGEGRKATVSIAGRAITGLERVSPDC